MLICRRVWAFYFIFAHIPILLHILIPYTQKTQVFSLKVFGKFSGNAQWRIGKETVYLKKYETEDRYNMGTSMNFTEIFFSMEKKVNKQIPNLRSCTVEESWSSDQAGWIISSHSVDRRTNKVRVGKGWQKCNFYVSFQLIPSTVKNLPQCHCYL